MRHGRCGLDWDARGYYLNNLAPFCSRESLEALYAQQPSSLALLSRGYHAIHWAWDARGHGRASTVSAAKQRLFRERLALAERDLVTASQIDPNDPTPFAGLITVAKATGVSKVEAFKYFSAAIAQQADHYAAHQQMLSFLSERWSGSHNEMLKFARQRAESAARGSDLAMLIVDAHLNIWSHIQAFDAASKQALAYLSQPAVRQEIHAAYMQSLGGGCQVRASTVYYRNSAAFAFFLLQEAGLARTEHQKIAGAYTEYPWVYYRQKDQTTRDVIALAKTCAG